MRTDQDREAALEAERAAERQREEARRVLAGPVQVDEVRAARMRRLQRVVQCRVAVRRRPLLRSRNIDAGIVRGLV